MSGDVGMEEVVLGIAALATAAAAVAATVPQHSAHEKANCLTTASGLNLD